MVRYQEIKGKYGHAVFRGFRLEAIKKWLELQLQYEPMLVEADRMLIPKLKRIKDKKWLADIHSLPCLITKQQTNIVAHHLLRSPSRLGMGGKSGDNHIVPLTDKMHKALHNHGNETEFFKLHNIEDAVEISEELFRNKNDIDACFAIIYMAGEE